MKLTASTVQTRVDFVQIVSSYFENKYGGQNAACMTFKRAVTRVTTEL
jgi:hypothetical protein